MTYHELTDLLERAADRHPVGSLPLTEMLVRSRRARRRRSGLLAVGASLAVGGVVVGTILASAPNDVRPLVPAATSGLPSPTPPQPDRVGGLEGTWNVTALVGADGESAMTGPLAQKMKLTFANGEVSGTDGCNDVFGGYRQSGDPARNLRFTEMGTSLVRCIDTAHDGSVEPPLLDRLNNVRHLSGTGDVRYLHAENWMIIAELHRSSSARACTRCPDGAHSGTVTGRLVFVGGPYLNAPYHALSRGIVRFDGAALKAQDAVGADGRFTDQLPPGVYTVTATSPDYSFNGRQGICRASAPVRVADGDRVSVKVFCNIK